MEVLVTKELDGLLGPKLDRLCINHVRTDQDVYQSLIESRASAFLTALRNLVLATPPEIRAISFSCRSSSKQHVFSFVQLSRIS